MDKTLYVIDGYALIYRSYFAFINRPLRAPDGRNVSAFFGFFKTLFSFQKSFSPYHLVVALDSLEPTFRHKMYEPYKQNRDKAPDDLHEQVPLIEEFLSLLSIPQLRCDGYEADDIIGALATHSLAEGRACRILSGDKDLLQLVDGDVKVLKQSGGSYIEIDREEVFRERGVYPEQIVDYLALVGDSSDNIPGVRGVGQKTAEKLLGEYQTFENIYANLDKISSSLKTKLESGKENGEISRKLALIERSLPNIPDVDSLKIGPANLDEIKKVLTELKMDSLMKDLLEVGVLDQLPSIEESGKNENEGVYHAVTDEETFSALLKQVKEAGLFSFDVETDSLDEMCASPVGFSVATKPEEGFYIPLKTGDEQLCLSEERVRSGLKEILEDPKLKIVGQNFKYDLRVLKRWGILPANIHFDTMIAAWLLESNDLVNMDFLAEKYLSYRTIHFKEVVPAGKTFGDIELKEAVQYAAEDADITFRLYQRFKPLLKERALTTLFEKIEMPLLPLLASMEDYGVRLDVKVLEKLNEKLTKSLSTLESEIYLLCGHNFNINSTKQLQTILFDELKLNPVKKTKTGYSTDTTVLSILARESEVPEKILEHRTLSKLKSTYIEALPLLLNPQTGAIHTHFIQTGTASGRLSSRDPNMQNIPIRDEIGRSIRRAFTPRKGYRFLSADYSQIELVVLAHLSEDENLIHSFQKNEDIHKRTAALLFSVEPELVSVEQRQIAKTINFGVIYGMSPFRLSNELNIPQSVATSFIDSYFSEYSGVTALINQTLSEAQESGFVRTFWGRIRHIPHINSRNNSERKGAERVAVNTKIQGSAADIMKIAMLKIEKALKESSPNSVISLQIHDECILEVPEREVESVSLLVKQVMESAVELKVPLRVNIELGETWGEIH